MPLTIRFQGKQIRGLEQSLKARSMCRLAGGFPNICNKADVTTMLTWPEIPVPPGHSDYHRGKRPVGESGSRPGE